MKEKYISKSPKETGEIAGELAKEIGQDTGEIEISRTDC